MLFIGKNHKEDQYWSPICMYVSMYVCICVYVCMYVYMYVCMYVCLYVCLSVCMYVYMYRVARPGGACTTAAAARVRNSATSRPFTLAGEVALLAGDVARCVSTSFLISASVSRVAPTFARAEKAGHIMGRAKMSSPCCVGAPLVAAIFAADMATARVATSPFLNHEWEDCQPVDPAVYFGGWEYNNPTTFVYLHIYSLRTLKNTSICSNSIFVSWRPTNLLVLNHI